jgi:hypothetical protein
MALRRLKQPGDRAALDRAVALGAEEKKQSEAKSGGNSFLWYERVVIDHLLDEARAELGVAK